LNSLTQLPIPGRVSEESTIEPGRSQHWFGRPPLVRLTPYEWHFFCGNFPLFCWWQEWAVAIVMALLTSLPHEQISHTFMLGEISRIWRLIATKPDVPQTAQT
jgi:hypothetical protein